MFAWGSNGFGQLGVHSSKGAENWSNGGNGVGGSRLSPRRVEGELNHSFVVAVACGERHSVALTRLGEVYCWGDNKNGQLGVTMSNSESHVSIASNVLFSVLFEQYDKEIDNFRPLRSPSLSRRTVVPGVSRLFGPHSHVEERLQSPLLRSPL